MTEAVLNRHLAEYGREQESLDEEYNSRLICAYCGEKIDPAEGAYEVPIRIRKRKVSTFWCSSCYEGGPEGDAYYDEREVRDLMGGIR